MSQENGFIHSVKVPKIYKSASKIVRQVLEEGGSIKELLYTTVKVNLKGVYALITKTIQHNAILDAAITKVKLIKENPQLNIHLAKVLVAEILLGKGFLQGESKPIQTVCKYQESLESAFKKLNTSVQDCEADICKPRYVRVNTLGTTCDEVIKVLRGEGWRLVPFHGDYSEFLEAVQRLQEDEFLKDFHVKDLLVFPPGTEFYNCPLYHDSTIILQDKASCLPALVLSPTSTSFVLDMCAAPGMKTTLLSALMRDKGRIHAVERNQRRFDSMCSMITNAGCTNVTTHLGDSLTLQEDWMNQVDMVLVDPTCSGTGMTERAKLFTQPQTSERLDKLSRFQYKLLMHALTGFAAAQRVVYSTCSVLVEENEAVVAAVLENLPHNQWSVAPAMPEWPSRGSSDYEFGEHCITARPREDLTTGFFIALFEKVSSCRASNKSKEGNGTIASESLNLSVNDVKERGASTALGHTMSDVDEGVSKIRSEKKSKKKRREKQPTSDGPAPISPDSLAVSEEVSVETHNIHKKMKKWKQKHCLNIGNESSSDQLLLAANCLGNVESDLSKPKKKKELLSELEIVSQERLDASLNNHIPVKRRRKSKCIDLDETTEFVFAVANEPSEGERKKKRRNKETADADL